MQLFAGKVKEGLENRNILNMRLEQSASVYTAVITPFRVHRRSDPAPTACMDSLVGTATVVF
jgi:hypothetical protein